MNVLFLVDLHWRGAPDSLSLPELDDYDLVLLGGDISHFGGPVQVAKVVEAIRQRGPEVLAVAGNCDAPEVDGFLAELKIGLDRSRVEINGVCFSGLSAGLPFGGCPHERTEVEFEKACEQLPKESSVPHILVSHQPPFNTACDKTGGRHVGSRAIRAYVERARPELVLSGHIHESIGVDRIGAAVVANPGPWMAGRCLHFEIVNGVVGAPELLHLPL